MPTDSPYADVLAAILARYDGPVVVVGADRTIRAASADFRARCEGDPIGHPCHEVLHGRSEPCPPDEVDCPLGPAGGGASPRPHRHRVARGVRRERVLAEPIGGAGSAVVACLARLLADEAAVPPDRLPALRELELDIRPVRLELRRAALSHRPLLLRGEPGTRLSSVAVAVHRLSRRRGPFEERAGCELTRGRLGELLLNEPGLPATLHVQDVHELDPQGWAALAARIGDGSPAGRHGFRVVASTGVGTGGAVTGRVEASTMAVLGRLSLRVPPVRERRDLPLLVARGLRDAARRALSITPEAYAVIARHAFPGNLDELESVLRYAAVLADGEEVRVEHLPGWLRAE